jgi:transcription elongation factor Elf1
MNKTFQCIKCGKQFKAGIITRKDWVFTEGIGTIWGKSEHKTLVCKKCGFDFDPA